MPTLTLTFALIRLTPSHPQITHTMGLAAPRNKRKIGADPRNLAWSANAATTSVGHKLMTAQGWSEGQALGSRGSVHHATSAKDENAARLAAARVGVIFKDDTMGLGAKLKSKDLEGQRTGMDAFVGLLGRLNAKDEGEVEEVEKRVEDRKLAKYAAGRWGGMVFVPGGVLVGGEEFGTKKEAREKEEAEKGKTTGEGETAEERAQRKEEKRRRKEERRLRREAKAARKSQANSQATSQATSENEAETSRSTSRSRSKSKRRSQPAPDEPVSSASDVDQDEAATSKTKKRKRSETSTLAQEASPAPSPKPVPRTGRQILRGRNIEAKRAAFRDDKGLDGIFMRAAA